MKTVVAIQNAQSYDHDVITKAVDDLIDSLGGLSFVEPNSKVFLKANLVRDMSPDRCGTTHPMVVQVLAEKLIREKNATVTVGDSSGGAYTKAFMNNVFRTCKMDVACQNSGASLITDFDYTKENINGVAIKSLDIINAFLEADVVINIGKLKSHSFTGYTGAVKNLFGLVPGLVKVEVHSMYPDISNFVDCLIDIERYANKKIALHVVDAVWGMEGEGPTNGKPKFIGKLIASTNAYLCDCVCVSLFDDPLQMPLLKRAVERGIVDANYRNECLVDWSAVDASRISDFQKVVVLPTTFLNMPRWLSKLLKNNLSPRITIRKKVCKTCGKCVTHCPAKALSVVNKKVKINQSKCIRCYCCQELCPHNAVKLNKPIVYRVVRAFSHTKNKSN